MKGQVKTKCCQYCGYDAPAEFHDETEMFLCPECFLEAEDWFD